MLQRIGSLSPRSLLTAIVVLAIILAAVVAPVALRSSQRLVQDACDQSYLTVHAFAQSAAVWLDRASMETLSRVSDLMLATGSVYILIVDGGTPVLARMNHPTPEFEDRPSALPQESRATLRQIDGLIYVDTLVPLPSTSAGGLAGYVRVGVDVSFLLSRLAAVRLRTALFAVGTWVSLSGLLIGTSLWQHRQPSRSDTEGVNDAPASTETRILGGLVLDIARREVTVFDAPISLTPKQFDLLVVLTSRDRHVFSEEEILATVWPDSPYADSNDIRQCVYRLRQRFKKTRCGSEAAIVNVKGFGYQFDPEELAVGPETGEGGENA